MKTKQRYIYVKICALVLLVWLTACDRDPHEGERGLTVALDNSQCPDVPIGAIKLCIYGTSGSLCATYDYTDAHGIAAALLPLEAGHYTVAVVINADGEVTETSTLTALHEWLDGEMSHDKNLLSGMAEVDVAEDGITRVTVPLRQGIFTLPTLRLLLTLPDPKLPDYTPAENKTRAAGADYIIRCVAELVKAGTDNVVLHKPVTPEPQADGTYLVELSVPEGVYDLRLWTDYARTAAPLADTYYHTESLKAVNIVTEPYTANTDAKDAAYHNENDLTLPEEGTMITIPLQRPLAKYRIIADDVETYRKLAEAEPEKYPPLEELTVTVQYENFFPSAFNAADGIPSNSMSGLSFTSTLSDVAADTKEVQIASDWIMTGVEETFVKVSIVICNKAGEVITRTSGTKIAHKRNYQTTIRGNFLTAGIGSGGVSIDTEWEDTYIIEF